MFIEVLGQRAHTADEKECVLRYVLTPQDSIWVHTIHLGAYLPGGTTMWWPSTLLASAAHGSDRIALEYRAWSVDGHPRPEDRFSRDQWRDYTRTPPRPGVWFSSHTGASSDGGGSALLRDSRYHWAYGHKQADGQAFFPVGAGIPSLFAARVIRHFWATGKPDPRITWTRQDSSLPAGPVLISGSIEDEHEKATTAC